MKKRLFIAIILLVLVVGGIIGFNKFRDQMIADFFAGRTAPPVAVSVVKVTPVAWKSGIDTIGTALSSQEVDLSVEAAGLVRDVLFSPNEKVTKDQKLVQIDERIERADLGAAQAALDLAVTQLERNKTLEMRGIGASTTVDVANAEEKSARAQVAKLTAVLDQKEMLAPFDGVIGISQIEPGQYVTPGTKYATLQNLDKMQVDFTVPEQSLGNVSIGAPVTAATEVGDLSFDGSIIAIEPRVDPVSRLVSVRAMLDGTNGALFPGQFLRVRVTLPVDEGILALPQTAVSVSLYGDSVFVVRKGEDDKLTVAQVFVDVGRRSGGMVEITRGLTAGDEVVNAGQNRLVGGAAVVIDNTVSPSAARE